MDLLTKKKNEEPEDEFGSPAEMFEIVDRIRSYVSFWKTRDAILNAEPLHDLTSKQLEEKHYLGPWKFNVVQSALCGTPSLVIFWVAGLLGAMPSERPRDVTFAEILKAFGIPFILMLSAYIVGRASFWKRDVTTASRKRAARIFLYLDVSYGFYPQLAMSCRYSLSAIYSN